MTMMMMMINVRRSLLSRGLYVQWTDVASVKNGLIVEGVRLKSVDEPDRQRLALLYIIGEHEADSHMDGQATGSGAAWRGAARRRHVYTMSK